MYSLASDSLRIRPRWASRMASRSGGPSVVGSTSAGGVAGLEEVDTLVVGEEHLACVETRRRGEGASSSSSGVVREMWSVPGVAPHDHVVPAGVAGRSRQDQHLFQLGKRQRIMPGSERQRPVGKRGTQREAAGSSSV